MQFRRFFTLSLAVLAAIVPVTAAHASTHAPPSTAHGAHITSLDAAVAAGTVDADLVATLRSAGHTDAVLAFDQGDVLTNADNARGRAHAADRDRAAGAALHAGFDALKHAVHGKVKVQVLDGTEYLPLEHIELTSEQQLLQLVNTDGVAGVHTNKRTTIGSMDPESSALVRQPTAAAAGYRGAGKYVAVLDTGLDYTRSDFGSCTAPATPSTCKVAVAYDQAANDGYLDDDGHGTNVAGIVTGIAPGAKLIGIDVFQGHSAYQADMFDAIDYLVRQKQAGVDIVSFNMSIWSKSWNANGTACADDLGFASARAAGILPVVIAGNGGQITGVSYPGCIPGALTVGAVYDANVGVQPGYGKVWADAQCSDTTTYADKVVCFSQSGPNLKMLAPGSVIVAAGIEQSGTSQAAPHVAGAAAVVAASRSGLTLSQLEYALVNSGPSIVDRDGRTRHRLDVYSAVLTAQQYGDTTPPSIVKPGQSVSLNVSLGAGTVPNAVPVKVNWSATDASGIASYAPFFTTNGGVSWTRINTATATSTSAVLYVTPGTTMQVAVSATDTRGNTSGWAYGVSFKVRDFAETNAAFTYHNTWKQLAYAPADGGALKASAITGAWFDFTFTGRTWAWVASEYTNRGQADVWVDGVYKGRFSTYSATARAKYLVYGTNVAYGTHHVIIQVVGTAGHPTVDVDSIVTLG
jgi:hypothetical protein